MNKLNDKIKGVILFGGLILVGVVLYYFFIIKEDSIEIYENQTERNILIPYEENYVKIEETENTSNNNIIVDISGEVKNPGVLELEEGSRIKDAINEAGGTTKNADTTDINLAYKLEDGMKIKIPTKSKKKENQVSEGYISTNAGNSIENQNFKNKPDTQNKKVININRATKEELETIPGVGASTAEKIIKYRKEKGKFEKKEDIKNVSGIGDAKYNKMKDYISI